MVDARRVARIAGLLAALLVAARGGRGAEKRFFSRWKPDNFFCIRFPMEGIFEIGGYYRGRFTEVHRGVRKGNYGEWREIEVTVRGDKIDMRVDRLGRLPSWKFTGFKSGAVGVGVTGGEVAFRDVRVRILR